MAETITNLNAAFWNEQFWFPGNVTWKELENIPGGIYHSQPADVLASLPLGAVIYFIRSIFERFIFSPIGRSYGLKNTVSRHVTPNKVLEHSYRKNKQPNDALIQGYSKQTDLSVRQVERWFRIRRNQERAGVLKKFTETFWRFTFYLSLFIYGLVVLWDKPWFWNTRECWYGYPHQHVTSDIYWYYMVELGFYWSLLVSQFSDVKRKDFMEMFTHHVVTIVLMSGSWAAGLYRVGTLVLCVHDAADYWLEAAKLAKYTRKQRLTDFFFIMLMIVWFVTRLVIFPLKVWKSSFWESHEIIGQFWFIYLLNGLLFTLQLLHVLWFYMICRIAYTAVTTGKVQQDVRSESEEAVSDNDDAVSSGTMKHG